MLDLFELLKTLKVFLPSPLDAIKALLVAIAIGTVTGWHPLEVFAFMISLLLTFLIIIFGLCAIALGFQKIGIELLPKPRPHGEYEHWWEGFRDLAIAIILFVGIFPYIFMHLLLFLVDTFKYLNLY